MKGAYGATVVVLATLATPAAAVSPVPSTGSARLVGQFILAAKVTVAKDIPGEREGSHFLRTWTFSSPCPTGPCPTIVLVRARDKGTDRLSLRLRAPGYYVGSAQFYASARCGGRTYAKGVLVPFTIAVRVTAASVSAGAVLATRIRAAYTNSQRTNLTPCVAALGHDAATYHGHVVPAATT